MPMLMLTTTMTTPLVQAQMMWKLMRQLAQVRRLVAQVQVLQTTPSVPLHRRSQRTLLAGPAPRTMQLLMLALRQKQTLVQSRLALPLLPWQPQRCCPVIMTRCPWTLMLMLMVMVTVTMLMLQLQLG